MIEVEILSPAALTVQLQLFVKGPTLNGDLASPDGRDQLVRVGHVLRQSGWNWLTSEGIEAALAAGAGMEKVRVEHMLREIIIHCRGLEELEHKVELGKRRWWAKWEFREVAGASIWTVDDQGEPDDCIVRLGDVDGIREVAEFLADSHNAALGALQ